MTSSVGMTPDEHGVLAAIARGALGDDYVADVPGRMMSSIRSVASAAERNQLIGAIRALGTRAGAFALTGRPVPVSWLGQNEAEAVLQSLVDSRVGALRRLGTALSSLAGQALYGYDGPIWKRIGYPGPLGDAVTEPKILEPLVMTSDERLSCDVVVVGSGAGGACAAAGLAQAGLDVIVVERGGYRNESDFHHLEGPSMREMFLYGGTLTTSDLGVLILAGSTLGGGTVVNYTTSFKTPPHVLEQWRAVSGIDAFASGEFEEHLDAAAERIGVNTDSSAASKRDEIVEVGLKQLGWHVDMMPRAVRGCTQDEQCGYCGFGCRIGAKQSAMRVYLQDASDAGARLIVGADIDRVTIGNGRATGVVGSVGHHTLTIDARAVISAGGAIETPALLLRSKLGGRVGHDLHLHPGTAAWGIFDDDVHIWEGTLQARYSNEFVEWDGGWGPMLETVPVHPGSWSMALSWRSAAHHRTLMEHYSKVGFCAVLPRDTTSGRVKIGRGGRPRIDYRLSADDERRIAEGVVRAARVVEAAGARRVYSLHKQSPSYMPGVPGSYEKWMEETKRLGYGRGAATLASYHQMGSCRMGTDPSTSAVNADNESHEVKNLFVVDASAFPTASGVNPMLTIYGIARRAASRIADRLA